MANTVVYLLARQAGPLWSPTAMQDANGAQGPDGEYGNSMQGRWRVTWLDAHNVTKFYPMRDGLIPKKLGGHVGGWQVGPSTGPFLGYVVIFCTYLLFLSSSVLRAASTG